LKGGETQFDKATSQMFLVDKR